MNKYEFLYKLERKLSGLPKKEVNERLAFYTEMIDDLIEEGLTESDALNKIGSVEDIARQITEEIPLGKIIIDKVTPKRKLTAWEIVLLVVGSPIWFSLLISLLAVIFSVYVSIWAVVVSCWSVFVSLAVTSPVMLVYFVVLLFGANLPTAIASLSICVVAFGLSLLLFVLCKLLTKTIAKLTVVILRTIKSAFIKKDDRL